MKTFTIHLILLFFSIHIFSQEIYKTEKKSKFIEKHIKREYNKNIICSSKKNSPKTFIVYWTTIKLSDSLKQKPIDKTVLENNVVFFGKNKYSKIKYPSYGYVYFKNELLFLFDEMGKLRFPSSEDVEMFKILLNGNFKFGFVIDNLKEENVLFLIGSNNEMFILYKNNIFKYTEFNVSCCFDLLNK